MSDRERRTVDREVPGDLVQLARHSVATILAGQEPNGAFVAAPTFANYRHAWLRDGSFCALAMSEAGHHASAERFLGWAAQAVAGQAQRIRRFLSTPPAIPSGQDYLPARFGLAGDRLDDGWWDWQHDGYGTWLWVMAEHQRRYARLPEGVEPGIELAVEYLLHAWTLPCFDWWEENDGHVHVATLGAVAAGLGAATEWPFLPASLRTRAQRASTEIRYAVFTRGVRDGHLVKWLDDGLDVDASLLACMTPLGLFGHGEPVASATLAEIERGLVIDGGVHRHPRDTFYGGGAWPLLSGLLGMNYAALGRIEEARRQLDWIAAQAASTGDLPEQVRHHMLAPDFLAEWLARWGEPACPLLWSHATYLLLGLRLEVFGPADLGCTPFWP